jgi:hypothetical protein
MTEVTSSQLTTIRKELSTAFRAELQTLSGGPRGLKKKTIDDLVAGHADGMRNMIQGLVRAGIITILDP